MMQRLRRELVVILAANVAGYAALMEAAEEATYARLTRLLSAVVEPAIAGHRGRIFKPSGDGLLAVFESAVDAVDYALLV